ncbi:MAG: ParB/RepB/Spo0J family partition protein [Cardiobacteriaceae bacterium]|nr:ParB/RepB/Spo0J family partition protein [Cardiobacteriaceae bacterium]
MQQPSLFTQASDANEPNSLTEQEQAKETWVYLPISAIKAGEFQPRYDFEPEKLAELSQSIAELGVLQPLIVRRLLETKRFDGVEYEIIAGERRFRAAKMAGLTQVPCWVRDYAQQTAATVALVENLQRADLNVVEVARGYQRLAEEFSMTHQQIAQKVGCSRSAVSNTLRLLGLTPVVLSALQHNRIEMAHARAMLSLSPNQQESMLQEIEKKGLSVREVEQRVRQSALGYRAKPRKASKAIGVDKDAEVLYLEQRLTEWFGVEVSIEHQSNGQGKVVFHYHDLDALDDVLQRLGYVS